MLFTQVIHILYIPWESHLPLWPFSLIQQYNNEIEGGLEERGKEGGWQNDYGMLLSKNRMWVDDSRLKIYVI